MPTCYICKVSSHAVESREMHLTYHRFPKKHRVILEKWKKFAECPEGMDTEKLLLCSSHFDKEHIINHPLRNRLKDFAVPCYWPPPSRLRGFICPNSTASDELEKGNLETEVVEYADAELVQSEPLVLEENQEFDHVVVCRTSSPIECAVDGGNSLDPKRDEGGTYHVDLLENVKQQLCRICGMKSEILSSIFHEDKAEEEDNISLEKKIRMYLPIKLNTGDGLPLCICPKCCGLVESWHELHVSCLAADSVLRKTFGINIYEIAFKNEEDQSGDLRFQEENTFGVEQQLRMESREPKEELDDYDENIKWDHSFECVPSIANLIFNRCRYCCQSFQFREECLLHRKECASEPAICDICGKRVHERRFFNIHFKKHLLMPGLCEKCGCQLCSKYTLMKHMKTCHGKVKAEGAKYFCEPCCRVFSLEVVFRAHQEWHKKKKKSNLRICSFECSQENGGVKYFMCPVCNSRFQDKLSLIVHMNNVNKTSCLKCKRLLQNEKEMLLHKCKKWLCRFCSGQFSNWKTLRQHELFHKTDKVFTCKVCGTKFATSLSFIRHRRIHRPFLFQCEECGKEFRMKHQYQDHMRKHTGTKLRCSFCNREYLSQGSLYKHKRKYHRQNSKNVNP